MAGYCESASLKLAPLSMPAASPSRTGLNLWSSSCSIKSRRPRKSGRPASCNVASWRVKVASRAALMRTRRSGAERVAACERSARRLACRRARSAGLVDGVFSVSFMGKKPMSRMRSSASCWFAASMAPWAALPPASTAEYTYVVISTPSVARGTTEGSARPVELQMGGLGQRKCGTNFRAGPLTSIDCPKPRPQPVQNAMNGKALFARAGLTFLLAIIIVPARAQGTLNASFSVVGAPSGGSYNYTLTLANNSSSTDPINTLWMSWIPGYDFLPSQPTGITTPIGWNAYVEGGGYGYYGPDGYSIEFTT